MHKYMFVFVCVCVYVCVCLCACVYVVVSKSNARWKILSLTNKVSLIVAETMYLSNHEIPFCFGCGKLEAYVITVSYS